MKKLTFIIISLHLFLSGAGIAFCQQLQALGFLGLSLENQLKAYFDTYRDGHTYISVPRFAGYIVEGYGISVIPYLKEYMKGTDLFSLRKNWPSGDSNPDFNRNEPNDVTLELIAYIWSRLHMYTEPYSLDEREIQWFIDEYKKRIDDYILAVKVIDVTVRASERMLYMVANWSKGPEGLEKYGHPDFGMPENRRGTVLKEYYEQRLGISNISIDYAVFDE